MAIILVADDEESIRDLVRFALRRSGHHVLESRSGTETLELLNSGHVDLLILDMMMPGIDGYQVQLEMSRTSHLRDIPVIVISGMQLTRDMFTKFSQVKKFIPKPFDPIELIKVVDDVIKSCIKKSA